MHVNSCCKFHLLGLLCSCTHIRALLYTLRCSVQFTVYYRTTQTMTWAIGQLCLHVEGFYIYMMWFRSCRTVNICHRLYVCTTVPLLHVRFSYNKVINFFLKYILKNYKRVKVEAGLVHIRRATCDVLLSRAVNALSNFII